MLATNTVPGEQLKNVIYIWNINRNYALDEVIKLTIVAFFLACKNDPELFRLLT
jgi:hypothetical protein